jgi:hypothetical protein
MATPLTTTTVAGQDGHAELHNETNARVNEHDAAIIELQKPHVIPSGTTPPDANTPGPFYIQAP